MQFKNIVSTNNIRKAANVFFAGCLLLLLFNPDAKAWMLKQFMAVGLFKAEIKNDTTVTNGQLNTVSFEYSDENGKSLSTDSLKGKVVLVNFWATWCPPCRAEMPSLNKLFNHLKDDKRIVFLFINEDEDMPKAKAYLESNGYSMPLQKSIGNIPSELYSGTLPTTIILNKDGNVAMKQEGIANYNTNKFLAQLKALF